jgi:D-3-phosphoglycerate dehydrogenase
MSQVCFAEAKLNMLQQINHSKGDIAYNVLDVGTTESVGDVLSFKQVQEKITMLDGVLSSRVLYGAPGILVMHEILMENTFFV